MTNPKRYDTDRDGDEYETETGPFVHWTDYETLLKSHNLECEVTDSLQNQLTQLRGNLSLAEEGLAAATQESGRGRHLPLYRTTTFTAPHQQGSLPCDHCGWGVAQHEARTLACPVKPYAEKSSEPPPVDNAHVAEGCEKFDE